MAVVPPWIVLIAPPHRRHVILSDDIISKPIKKRELHRVLRECKVRAEKILPLTEAQVQALKLNVLIAEDNPLSQKILEQYVVSSGHNCHIVSNGAEAVQYFKENPVEVIFMDCRMPVKSGYEATEEIREIEKQQNRQRTPIIALTVDVMIGTHERCLKSGM